MIQRGAANVNGFASSDSARGNRCSSLLVRRGAGESDYPKTDEIDGYGRILPSAPISDGTFDVEIGPKAMMFTLSLTIGPGESLHANQSKYKGPGKYANEIIAVYLGETSKEDHYFGLGTVTVAADGESGTFALNDGSVEGAFNCSNTPISV